MNQKVNEAAALFPEARKQSNTEHRGSDCMYEQYQAESHRAETLELPDSVETYRNLYILFKGDYRQMEWFYDNRTYADLFLMICMYNLVNSQQCIR